MVRSSGFCVQDPLTRGIPRRLGERTSCTGRHMPARRWATVAVASGCWLGAATALAANDGWAMTLAALSAALAWRQPGWRKACLLAAVAAAAAAYAASARDRLLAPAVGRLVITAPVGETARAVRSAAPVLLAGILAEDAVRVDGGVRLTVDVDRARDAAGWHSTRGRVQVLVAGSLAGPLIEHGSAG